MPTAYILKDEDDRIYIGSTTDIERRLQEHMRGHTASTRRMNGVQIVWQKEVSTLEVARGLERKIKKWKSRKMVELPISGEVEV